MIWTNKENSSYGNFGYLGENFCQSLYHFCIYLSSLLCTKTFVENCFRFTVQVSITDVCLNEEMLRVGVGAGLESIGEESMTRSVPNIQQDSCELPESRTPSPVPVKRAESEPYIPHALETENDIQSN